MDLLVKAYFNDKLRHSSCTACAVGNICGGRSEWSAFFVTDFRFQKKGEERVLDSQRIFGLDYVETGRKVIAASGYSVDELARIEFAFETASYGKTEDDWMFNGLLAVREVLADIHKVDFSGAQVYERQLAEIHATK